MSEPSRSNSTSYLALARTYLSVWGAARLGWRVREVPLVFLRVTDRCNSRCLSCDGWVLRADNPPELTTDEICGLVPALKKLRTRVVALLGGEPTIREDLETCIRAIRQGGMSVQIHTNGLAIDADRARSLADAGLNVARISCDHVAAEGYQRIRGVDGYDQAVAAMRHFRSLPEPLPVAVNVVISRLNQDVIDQFPDRAVEWGIQRMQFIPIHTRMSFRMGDSAFAPLVPDVSDLPAILSALDRAADRLRAAGIGTNSSYYLRHFDRAYTSRRRVRCAAGSFAVVVTTFGEVVPCYPCPSESEGPSVCRMPLDEAVNSEAFRHLRNCARTCDKVCWDQGETEPSLLFHMPYVLRHPLEVLQQVRFNSV